MTGKEYHYFQLLKEGLEQTSNQAMKDASTETDPIRRKEYEGFQNGMAIAADRLSRLLSTLNE